MPYRLPGEEVEARLDAAEVAAFGETLRRQRRQRLGRAAVVLTLAVVASALPVGWYLGRQRPSVPPQVCHEVRVMSGEPLASRRVVVCE
jgi:hypothetical protein